MNGNGSGVSLDPSTLAVVEQLARVGRVQRGSGATRCDPGGVRPGRRAEPGRLQAFKQLQSRLQLTPEKAAAWQSSVREGRR